MHLPSLLPMFDNRQSLFGVPAALILTGIAFAGLVVGFLWIRRTVDGEGEYHSFRATDRPRSTVAVAAVAIGAVAIVALVLQRLF